MSVNTLAPQLHGGLSLNQGESVQVGPYPADVTLKVPATLTGPARTETASGRIWVTDTRVIFLASPPATTTSQGVYDQPPSLTSLVIPYTALKGTAFNLPLFSPNNLVLDFFPDPSVPLAQTGLPDPGRGGRIEAKFVVGDGAGHGVWKRIEGERGVWAERRRQEEVLRELLSRDLGRLPSKVVLYCTDG